ncbi:PWWP-like protein [Artemisia annua]|uniref:PWWP-like protein n=1 Tax=Artemisia annua TaxID=35608 RepID=A0A2U1PAG9_ARTAN|nr:PWWP-like protein [Artemisia annua]
MGEVAGVTNGTLVENGNGKDTVNVEPSKDLVFGEILWVKLHEGSWWPAQIVDENSVSELNKPISKRSSSDTLVRLYGSYRYKYVDVHISRAEFKRILLEKKFNYAEIMKKSLEEDLPSFKSRKRQQSKNSKSKGTALTEGSRSQVIFPQLIVVQEPKMPLTIVKWDLCNLMILFIRY